MAVLSRDGAHADQLVAVGTRWNGVLRIISTGMRAIGPDGPIVMGSPAFEIIALEGEILTDGIIRIGELDLIGKIGILLLDTDVDLVLQRCEIGLRGELVTMLSVLEVLNHINGYRFSGLFDIGLGRQRLLEDGKLGTLGC